MTGSWFWAIFVPYYDTLEKRIEIGEDAEWLGMVWVDARELMAIVVEIDLNQKLHGYVDGDIDHLQRERVLVIPWDLIENLLLSLPFEFFEGLVGVHPFDIVLKCLPNIFRPLTFDARHFVFHRALLGFLINYLICASHTKFLQDLGLGVVRLPGPIRVVFEGIAVLLVGAWAARGRCRLRRALFLALGSPSSHVEWLSSTILSHRRRVVVIRSLRVSLGLSLIVISR